MSTKEAVNPTAEQLALVAAYPENTPFVMCNLLKFDGTAGAARYWNEYAPAVTPILEAAGGRTVWKGRAEHLLIGGPPHDWDAVWLARWPSKTEFLAMMAHPDFPASQEIRISSLTRMALILMTELTPTP